MKKFLAATLCMFVVAACAMGGAKSSVKPAVPSQMPEAAGAQDSRRSELDRLYTEVESEREQMKLPEPQASQAGGAPQPMATEPHPTSTSDLTCKPAKTDTCKTSCDLSDSISSNADKICKLADELQPDDDATAKCTKANETAKTAHTKCCGCL